MGSFSFKTTDTNESVWMQEDGVPKQTVYLTDGENFYEESEYESYGVFGGVDIFELFAKMNNLQIDRYEAILIWHSDDCGKYKYPNLLEAPNKMFFNGKKPLDCEYQGQYSWYANDYEDDEEDCWNDYDDYYKD